MLDEILKSLISSGPIGAILAFFMYANYKMVGKLFEVIEINTKAWTKAHERLDDIKLASERRRQEFKTGS